LLGLAAEPGTARRRRAPFASTAGRRAISKAMRRDDIAFALALAGARTEEIPS
jgi:hypothetical protein